MAPPSPVTRCAYLQAFVSHVWRELPLSLDLQVGFFWNAAPCGRCLGRGRRCDGPSQTGNGYLAASSAGREQGWAGLRPGIRNSGFYSCLWNPGHHRRAAQPLRLSVPNCVMDRTVFLSSTLSISFMAGEQNEKPEREGLWGIGKGWNWQGEYLSRCWHRVPPTEPELVRLFGFLHQEVEPVPLKTCTGKDTFTIQPFTAPPLPGDVTQCWTVSHFRSGRVMIANFFSPKL